MNWLNVREEIKPISKNFKYFGHNEKISNKMRQCVSSNNNYTCRYCGGLYPKYLMGIELNNEVLDEIDVCCRACYIVTHLNFGFLNEVKLYHSTLTQLEIIRKTIDFVIKNNRLPKSIDIDKKVKELPISLIEFMNLISKCKSLPNELDNYKIFFDSMNIDFILMNYGGEKSLFIDEVNDESIIQEEIEKHIPTPNEEKIFHEIFG